MTGIFLLAEEFIASEDDFTLLSWFGLFDAGAVPQCIGNTVRKTTSLFRHHPRPTDGGVMTS